MNEQIDYCVICGKQVDIDDNCLVVNDRCYCVNCKETYTHCEDPLDEIIVVPIIVD